MVHLFLWIAAAALVLSNAVSIIFIYKQYKARLYSQEKLYGCEEDFGYLELATLELKLENEKLQEINKKLNASNKNLKSKLDRVNNKVKQISEHFKLN